jgi:hypothetical protein
MAQGGNPKPLPGGHAQTLKSGLDLDQFRLNQPEL